MSHTAYIGFGSNQGDRLANYQTAKTQLLQTTDVTLKRESPLYHTQPMTLDGAAQEWYLNAVFEVSTTLTLHNFFKALKKIERDMGRDFKQPRWSTRLVDLDILFFGDFVYKDRVLMVPHKELIHRRFVLKPLCDLVPDFIHPAIELTLAEILANTRDTLAVMPIDSLRGQHA